MGGVERGGGFGTAGSDAGSRGDAHGAPCRARPRARRGSDRADPGGDRTGHRRRQEPEARGERDAGGASCPAPGSGGPLFRLPGDGEAVPGGLLEGPLPVGARGVHPACSRSSSRTPTRGKIESYQGEKILYRKETVDPPYAVVRTVIVTTKGQEIPVNYRLLQDGNRWRIYDVVIEGISLVNNYRSQFASILQKSSFPELMSEAQGAPSDARKKGEGRGMPMRSQGAGPSGWRGPCFWPGAPPTGRR